MTNTALQGALKIWSQHRGDSDIGIHCCYRLDTNARLEHQGYNSDLGYTKPLHISYPFLFNLKFPQFLERDLIQQNGKEDRDVATKLLGQWTSFGLEDVQLINYTVLLDLPGSSPNTVTLNNTGECYYPNGQPCNKETQTHYSQDLPYAYAAYSAKGTLTAEVFDVQYGSPGDLLRIKQFTNVSSKIALLKLGHMPLLYKVSLILGAPDMDGIKSRKYVSRPELSLLEEAGFKGALLYIDPCNLPKFQNLNNKAFMVSLNSGGDPSTPGYSSIDCINAFFSSDHLQDRM
ncbi:Inactive N-acetylated-alpha-linked acidic dipeptidase-like protein 2, partial [Ophiophagus hannah]